MYSIYDMTENLGTCMSLDPRIIDALDSHPCYNEKAHHQFARMHLPVAPRCNIQCNFCNRKFDCCNESRPGVTSEVLDPQGAIEKIRYVKERVPNLSVIGIAGPGDPLANEETFEVLEMASSEFPELTLCISTNGLTLPDCAERLQALGVRFVTVTMNALDAEVGSQIYDSVIFEGQRHSGKEGASILIHRQEEGIKKCAELGMAVKVNIVMIPGVNDVQIPELVRKVKGLGAYIVNILPLIPVEGTKFANLKSPTPKERRELMDLCELDAKMMRHCRQCRADAIGLLNEDRSLEFVHIGGCGSGCGPVSPSETKLEESLVAVAIGKDGKIGGFGNSGSFRIFATDGGTCRFLDESSVDLTSSVCGDDHRAHINRILKSIRGCGTVIVKEIGEMPMTELAKRGIRVVKTDGDINDAVRRTRDVY